MELPCALERSTHCGAGSAWPTGRRGLPDGPPRRASASLLLGRHARGHREPGDWLSQTVRSRLPGEVPVCPQLSPRDTTGRRVCSGLRDSCRGHIISGHFFFLSLCFRSVRELGSCQVASSSSLSGGGSDALEREFAALAVVMASASVAFLPPACWLSPGRALWPAVGMNWAGRGCLWSPGCCGFRSS